MIYAQHAKIIQIDICLMVDAFVITVLKLKMTILYNVKGVISTKTIVYLNVLKIQRWIIINTFAMNLTIKYNITNML